VHAAGVAGLFYPGDAAELRAALSQLLTRAPTIDLPAPVQALIVPHAGYVYSGSTAAAAYRLIAARSQAIRRVVLIGPSHRVYMRGVAMPESESFMTPLGGITVDRELKSRLLHRGDVIESESPYEMEHCLEVQLPFLQSLLDDFTVLPLIAGSAPAQHVASVLADLWDDDETLMIASSDLSHFHNYETARRIDATTCAAIVGFETGLSGEQACGAVGINGLLTLARRRGLAITELARCNSGDTAGDRSRVVGYGSFALHAPQ
jgi:MEMO1 family protein